MNDRVSAFGPIPPAAAALAAVVGIFEIGITVLELPVISGLVWLSRTDMLVMFGFDPLVFRFQLQMAVVFQDSMALIGGAPVTLLTYPWIHSGFMAAAFSVVFILCLGSLLSRLVPQWAVAASFVFSGVAGGLIYAALPSSASFLIGSAPGYLGMLGLLAGLFLMEHGKGNPAAVPGLVGFPFLLIGIKIVQDVIFGPAGHWGANAAGFAAGLLLSLLAIRGSLTLVRSGLRRLFSS